MPVEECTEPECSVQDKPYASMEAKLVYLGLSNGEDQITLKVKGQDGEELHYKMPKNEKLGLKAWPPRRVKFCLHNFIILIHDLNFLRGQAPYPLKLGPLEE